VTRRVRRGLPAAVLVAVLHPVAAAPAPAETRVVEVTAAVQGEGRTPEQARREALLRARDEAVAEAAGIHVAAQQLRLRSDLDGTLADGFSYLVQTTTQGRIVREEVTYRTRLEGEVPVYEATLVAEVALEEGERDPGFELELETSPASTTYRDGEPIVLEITASRRCYVTLLQVGADGSLDVLLPGPHAGDNEVDAGGTIRIPAASAGYEIRAQLSPGRDREHERLLVVATLDAVPFVLDGSPAGELSRDDPRGSLTALNRWLLRIPVARRAEALWEYQIVR
jgi:hypothetical protein